MSSLLVVVAAVALLGVVVLQDALGPSYEEERRQRAETRRLKAQADREELRLERERGEVVPVEDVVDLLDDSPSVGPGTTETLKEEVKRLLED